MKRVLIAAAAAVAAAVPASAAADGGNVAVGSVASVQAGSTGASPTVSASGGVVDTTVTVPVAVSGPDGNSANGSVGSVQAGGGNSSSGSVGSVQVAATHGAPAAHTDARVARADVAAPADVPGPGTNSAGGSLVTVQLGGGHSTNGGIARVDASQLSTQPQASAGTGTGTLVQLGSPGASGAAPVVLLLGPTSVRHHVAYQLTHDFRFDPSPSRVGCEEDGNVKRDA